MHAILLFLAFCQPSLASKGPVPQPSAEVDNEVVERRECKKDKESRLLEILPKESGCVLEYTKGSRTTESAKSVHGIQVCQSALQKIAGRLESAGYHCSVAQ